MSMSYVDKCFKKVLLLFGEVKEEIDKEHPHKTILALWAIIELFLRALVYRYKRATYDRPGKLISVFSRSILPLIRVKEDIVLKINVLYDLRKRAAHRPDIMGSKELEKAWRLFCQIIDFLLRELKRMFPKVEDILKYAKRYC